MPNRATGLAVKSSEACLASFERDIMEGLASLWPTLLGGFHPTLMEGARPMPSFFSPSLIALLRLLVIDHSSRVYTFVYYCH